MSLMVSWILRRGRDGGRRKRSSRGGPLRKEMVKTRRQSEEPMLTKWEIRKALCYLYMIDPIREPHFFDRIGLE